MILGTAMDDNRESRIRYTFTLEEGIWRILKETPSEGPEFAFRHEYRLRRNG